MTRLLELDEGLLAEPPATPRRARRRALLVHHAGDQAQGVVRVSRERASGRGRAPRWCGNWRGGGDNAGCGQGGGRGWRPWGKDVAGNNGEELGAEEIMGREEHGEEIEGVVRASGSKRFIKNTMST
jgi:hypothetical protein